MKEATVAKKQVKKSSIQNDLVVMDPQEVSIDVLLEKYAKGDEKTIQDVQHRVARGLARVEKEPKKWEPIFFETQARGFIPAGRIASAAGMDMGATLMNCFVQPVGDCINGVDANGYPSIYTALAQAAETMRRGGGVGYNFSRIRPIGAMVKGTQSRASGPLSYMKVFDRSCETVESAGARRGAQMAVLNCNHPDVYAFIIAKATKGTFNNFNLSVGVTDDFMRAVELDLPWQLVHKVAPGQDYINEHGSFFDNGQWIWKTVPARDLWDVIMTSTYNQAEPGILFLDQMNKENNLWYCEVIEATNPCAEQPLPNYGCCDLGSLNLTKYVREPFTAKAWFDYGAFERDIKVGVRMLDNVLTASAWPLIEQKEEAMNKRRIGLGFLGIGDAIIMLGKYYNRSCGVEFAKDVSRFMRDTAYEASVELAIEKGPFRLFDAKKYLKGAFVSRLPERIKRLIRKHGIRNSHLLSIAPTGTITLAFADNASNGIEPPFSWVADRKKRQMDGTEKHYEVADHAWRLYRAMGHDMTKLPDNFITALDMSVAAHVAIMEAVQPFIDTAISKTVNIPADYPYADFKDLYMLAWKAGLKGLATYRPNDTLGAVLSVKKEPKKEEAKPAIEESTKAVIGVEKALKEIVDEMYSQQIESRGDRTLRGITPKGRFYTHEGEVKFLLVINFLPITRDTPFGRVTIHRPIEFLLISDNQTARSSWDAAIRGISVASRYGAPITKIIDNFKETKWDHAWISYDTRMKEGKEIPMRHPSDVAVLGYVIEKVLKEEGYLTPDGQLAKNYNILHRPLIAGEEGGPVFESVERQSETSLVIAASEEKKPMVGKKCNECGEFAVIKKDSCDYCTNCGAVGSCG